MILNDSFFESLPDNQYEVGIKICKEIIAFDSGLILPSQKIENYNEYIEFLAILDAFIETNSLPYERPTIVQEKIRTIDDIMAFTYQVKVELEKTLTSGNFLTAREKYLSIFGSVFTYRFTDGDLKKIQELLNELRDKISNSELFDAKHKDRLLRRLESLQSELHKRMSSLDKFWGLVGEAGVVLGKFGNDAKPLVDIIKEIAQIVWRTQVTAEELPSGTTMVSLKQENN